MKQVYGVVAVWMLAVQLAFGQTNEAVFAETMRLPKGRTVGETAVAIGQRLLGLPYVNGTLESNDGTERLTVNFTEFDCATFVETVLALAETRHAARPDYAAFLGSLQGIRYRDGQIRGYLSRMHYFSDWLAENLANGRLVDLTAQLGGVPFAKPVCYMSCHRDRYALLDNSATFSELTALEKEINRRSTFFIPKRKVMSLEGQLQDGDLVGITSTKYGLDVAHEGFVVRRAGRAYLLHASSEFGRVMLSKVPLSDYLRRNPSHSGIIVARPRASVNPKTHTLTTLNTN